MKKQGIISYTSGWSLGGDHERKVLDEDCAGISSEQIRHCLIKGELNDWGNLPTVYMVLCGSWKPEKNGRNR